MTNKQIIEVVQAAEAGKRIEYRWKNCSTWAPFNDGWDWDFSRLEYRVAVEPREFKLIWWPGNECQKGGSIDGKNGWHIYNSALVTTSPDWKIIRVREIIG